MVKKRRLKTPSELQAEARRKKRRARLLRAARGSSKKTKKKRLRKLGRDDEPENELEREIRREERRRRLLAAAKKKKSRRPESSRKRKKPQKPQKKPRFGPASDDDSDLTDEDEAEPLDYDEEEEDIQVIEEIPKNAPLVQRLDGKRTPESKDIKQKEFGSWAAARDNVDYLGCYPDYAYLFPEYKDPKNYYTFPKKRKKGEPAPPPWVVPARPNDDRLPPPRDYRKHFKDGPARLIPSIDPWHKFYGDPTTMRLDKALRRCYDLAKSKHKRYFALQGGGLCMATNSKKFLDFDRLDPKKCETCTRVCKPGQKPCGANCINSWVPCSKRKHTACSHENRHQYLKGAKAGGNFTNSVYEIKDLSRVDEDQTDESVIFEGFSEFRYPEMTPGSSMDCPEYRDNLFPLSRSQLFIQQYFRPSNPLKGMLIDHSAGSGKTCLALNVIGNFMGKWRIIWVTRKSLSSVPNKNLYQDICQMRLREIIDSDEPLTLAGGEVLARTRAEKIAFVRSKRAPAILKRYGIEIEQQRIMTYDGFVSMIMRKGGQATKLSDQQLRDDPKHKDAGYQTLFVFDEAHNLLSLGLPKEERKVLDARLKKPVKIGDRKFFLKKDVYGNLGGVKGEEKMQGRDLIPAFLWSSYRLSRQNSAKILMLTATPMSTSPGDLFWLLNLALSDSKQRLSLSVSDYFDPTTMKLRDRALIKFASAAHGRISYLNSTQNPNTFARKMFSERIDAPLRKFHQKVVQDKLKAKKKNSKNKNLMELGEAMALYRNVGLGVKLRGKVFSKKVLEAYEKNQKKADKWDPEKEREKQEREYQQGLKNAQVAYGLLPSPKDAAMYERKAGAYRKWAEKHFKKLARRPKSKKNKEAKVPAELEDAVDENLDMVTFEEWKAQLPKRGKWVQEVMSEETLQLMPLEEWFKIQRLPALQEKQKKRKRLSKDQKKYQDWVMTDPASGYLRLKTFEEFFQPERDRVTLDGAEKGPNVAFLMWYKSYKPKEIARVMPYYAPKVHRCIEKIVEVEKQGKQVFGHGFKHVVFTFAVGGQRQDAGYGGNLLASLFQAREDLFQVLTVYKNNDQGRFVLRHDVPKRKPGQWGVAVLSSKDLINVNYAKHKGNKKIEFNKKIVSATQTAFNDVRNRYGDFIKVLILDGAYMEGVSAYDDGVLHLLDRGVSRSQLEQASARPARFCRSRHLPFFKGVGSFLQMYFYGYDGGEEVDGQDLYHQMLSQVPMEEQVNLNLMDVFTDLVKQFSLDYWLNYHLTEARTELQGKVVGYYSGHPNTYVVERKLRWSNQPDKFRSKNPLIPFQFVVDSECVLMGSDWPPGTRVTLLNDQGFSSDDQGTIAAFDQKTQVYTVNTARGGTVKAGLNQVMLAVGAKITFCLPYGVDLAQKVMDLSNYKKLHPGELEMDLVGDLTVPERGLKAIYTGFRHDVTYTLMGLVSLLIMLLKSSGGGVPVSVVLPEAEEHEIPPFVGSFSALWKCSADGTGDRELRLGSRLLKKFLEPKRGLSFLFLELQTQRCVESKEKGRKPQGVTEGRHMNLLLYVPESGTIERFDPLGYVAHLYDSTVLDAKLSDVFREINPELRYMSAAETCPVIGLQRVQSQEAGEKRHKLDPRSFCSAFVLFYMHARLLYASRSSGDRKDPDSAVFPMQFQRGLLSKMQAEHRGELTDFIRDYADTVAKTRSMITRWHAYDSDLPFWSNTVRLVKFLQREMKKKPGQNFKRLEREWFGREQKKREKKKTGKSSKKKEGWGWSQVLQNWLF